MQVAVELSVIEVLRRQQLMQIYGEAPALDQSPHSKGASAGPADEHVPNPLPLATAPFWGSRLSSCAAGGWNNNCLKQLILARAVAAIVQG
jgi:hypothetical protein